MSRADGARIHCSFILSSLIQRHFLNSSSCIALRSISGYFRTINDSRSTLLFRHPQPAKSLVRNSCGKLLSEPQFYRSDSTQQLSPSFLIQLLPSMRLSIEDTDQSHPLHNQSDSEDLIRFHNGLSGCRIISGSFVGSIEPQVHFSGHTRSGDGRFKMERVPKDPSRCRSHRRQEIS